MPLITGCTLHIGEKPEMPAYSLEHARRLAASHIGDLQPVKIEIRIGSLPSQVWAYAYDIKAWVLQR